MEASPWPANAIAFMMSLRTTSIRRSTSDTVSFAQVSMGAGAPVMQPVTINHVTAFQPGVMLNLGDNITVNPRMNDFVFTNNIVNAGTSPTQTTGGGHFKLCLHSPPIISLANVFPAVHLLAQCHHRHSGQLTLPANTRPETTSLRPRRSSVS